MLFKIFVSCLGAAGLAAAAAPSPTQSGLTASCNSYYDVVSGDTCNGIIAKYNNAFTLSNFYSWNPAVGSSCTNLQIGYYVCVGVSSAASPTPTGTASNCNKFYVAKSGDTCQGIVNTYGTFTLSQFYTWNPSINSQCTNIQVGDSYCVGVSGSTSTTKTTLTTKSSTTTSKSTTTTTSKSSTKSSTTTSAAPSPTQSGIVSNCKTYYLAASGDTCTTIASKYSTTVALFESWNPAINSQCTNLIAGYYYCVAVTSPTTTSKTSSTTTKPSTTTTKTSSVAIPSPTQSGIVANCNKYYDVASGDDCPSVEAKYGISDAQFKSWNTGINSGCTNLWAGYWCCVGVA